jgi:hypothetical protein
MQGMPGSTFGAAADRPRLPRAQGVALLLAGYPFGHPGGQQGSGLESRHDLDAEHGLQTTYLGYSAAGSPARGWSAADRQRVQREGAYAPSASNDGRLLTPQLKMFFRIVNRWSLDRKACASLLDLPRDTAVDLLEEGRLGLEGRDRLDRVANVIAIYVDLHQLLRSDDAERAWLHEYRDDLGTRPIDLLLSGRLEDLIDLRRYVELVAGR